MIKRLLVVAVFCCISLSLYAALRSSQTLIVDDHRVGYIERGTGVTVVFESGLGDSAAPWQPVFDEVAHFAHAFAYDRPGYGISGKAFSARDGAHVVVELHELLRLAGAKPPYVIVGHSMGGLYAELFARTYPDETAGLVLVEASPADFTLRCRREHLSGCEVPRFVAAALPEPAHREFEQLDATRRALDVAPPLRDDLPLFVVSAGRHDLENTAWVRLWDRMQRELASRASEGKQIIAERSGHYVQRDAPRVVVEAIREAVRRVRATP